MEIFPITFLIQTLQSIMLSFLLFSLPTISSQSATPPKIPCLTLDSSNVCGNDFVGYPVVGFPNVTVFNAALSSAFLDTNSVANEFEHAFGCRSDQIKPVISGFRYQLSFWCSAQVLQALKSGQCSVDASHPPKGPLLCQPECLLATASVQKAFEDTTACPSSASLNSNRTNLITSMSSICSVSKTEQQANGPHQYCFQGVPLESQSCGMFCKYL